MKHTSLTLTLKEITQHTFQRLFLQLYFRAARETRECNRDFSIINRQMVNSERRKAGRLNGVK